DLTGKSARPGGIVPRESNPMISCKPYSLKSAQGNSDEYYRVISAFAERWLESVQATLARPVADFLAFYQAERSFAEVAFEMLARGGLRREHGAQALHRPAAPAWMLAKLVETQDRLPLPAIEKPIKTMRGLVQGLATGDTPAGPGSLIDELP